MAATKAARRWRQHALAQLNPFIGRGSTTQEREYEFRGAALQIQTSTDKQVMVAGLAGTGKSLAWLMRIHLDAMKYPRSRQLILRQTRESLTESTLVTFEEHVLPAGSPMLQGPQRRNRQSYRYPNGSVIVVGGLDKPTKIMSTDYDRIYIPEALEVSEHAWETATTRNRHFVMPFQQVCGDTNPDHPRHWIKLRADAGKFKMLESRHEDNPRLWNLRTGAWTKEGEEYIATLDALTGSRYLRLRLGKWAAAEGVIYEEYDAAVHLIDSFEVPDDWARSWAIDFGYVNPFVWGHFAESPDGDLHLIQQIYMTQRLVEDHAETIRKVTEGHPKPVQVVGDHDAEDRATFEAKTGYYVEPAKKSVSDGIQAVKERLRSGKRGKPRLFIHRGSLIERDSSLVDKKRPTCVQEEFDSYVWDERAGQKKGDTPLKENDHGMDMVRYKVATSDLGGSMGTDDELHEAFWSGEDRFE